MHTHAPRYVHGPTQASATHFSHLGILVDKDGARFVSELGYRSVVTDAILHNGFPFAGNGPTVA